MTQLELALERLRQDTTEMWLLVAAQLHKSNNSLKTFDHEFAREVLWDEKRVNSLELKIDRDCENIIALFNPVAIDLRFVLAILKINNNLERLGDIAKGISKLIINETEPYDEVLLERTRFHIMFEAAIQIVEDVLNAFNKEDTRLARSLFERDKMLDQINAEANQIISDYIRENLDRTEQALNILSIIRRLERVGDQSMNIAEEIIFYLEAKVLRHKKL